MTDAGTVAALERVVAGLAPLGAPMTIRAPFEPDEARWFLAGLEADLFSFTECNPDCFRLKKWAHSGPDHFLTPAGKPRHLFSKPDAAVAWLNREYIPHLAAYARAALDFGLNPSQASFSLYRKFARDLITKRAGQGYETDAEFYDGSGGIHLQIEAKADRTQTTRLASEIRRAKTLQQLAPGCAKEIEYVLDLGPGFLWIVGPGSVDPAEHLFSVEVDDLNARFTPVDHVPGLPTT